jgi:hypothetical protein
MCPTMGPASADVSLRGPDFDDQISWPTAVRTAPDLALDDAGCYTVIAWIDGKEKVYGSIP